MEAVVFIVAAAIILGGAVGVITTRNPVHSALMLVATLFGVAVLFVAQDAHFLAAVQVIVYAGAIVVLFLFVIMLLGVDRSENLRTEPLVGQRPGAALVGVGLLAAAVTTLVIARSQTDGVIVTGARSVSGSLTQGDAPNVNRLAEALFTRYLFAFEITSVLLVIAVVGGVLLARRPTREQVAAEAESPGPERPLERADEEPA